MALYLSMNPVGSSQGSASSSAVARNGDQGKGWQLTYTFTKADYDAAGGYIWFLIPYGSRIAKCTIEATVASSAAVFAGNVSCLSHDEIKSGTLTARFSINNINGVLNQTGATSIGSGYDISGFTAFRLVLGGTLSPTDSYTVALYAVATIRA